MHFNNGFIENFLLANNILTLKWKTKIIAVAAVATIVSRFPLHLNPNEENGYAALKGSMVGAITFFPCLIGAEIKFFQSALIILPLLVITFIFLQSSKQEVWVDNSGLVK